MAKARLVIDGVVQGIGYRALVKQVARQTGLKGLVRNLEDTKVEVFCEGQEDNIRKFFNQIDRKTESKDVLGINVTEIECYWEGQDNYRPPWKEYVGFEIDYQVSNLSPIDNETLENQEFAKLYFTGFRDEMKGFRDEMKGFRHETNINFKTMDAKYGDISRELKGFRKTVKEFLDAFLAQSKRGE